MTAVERLRRNMAKLGDGVRRRVEMGYNSDSFGGRSGVSIRTAKERPAGVSDVAWRIELRRRADPGRYVLSQRAEDASPARGW